METNAMHPSYRRPMFAPLAKAVVLVLSMLALGYFAVLADTNTYPPQGGFAGHAAASQMSPGIVATGSAQAYRTDALSSPATKWDVDPYVDPAAKVAEPIATF